MNNFSVLANLVNIIYLCTRIKYRNIMKKILVLNGGPRLKGNTYALIEKFKDGAEAAGNEVTVINLKQLEIKPCLGCLSGGKNPDAPCVQKDGMLEVYPHYEEADVVVLASPMYYWSITGLLKTAFDRLFAVAEKHEWVNPKKECVMLMAAEGDTEDNFEPVRHYYNALTHHMDWKSLGEVYAGGVLNVGDIAGHNGLQEAYDLGKSI